jgi:hypothetical protein
MTDEELGRLRASNDRLMRVNLILGCVVLFLAFLSFVIAVARALTR